MDAYKQVIDALKEGHAAIFPTDTVYGLGVAVECAPGSQEIFDLKRRDEGKPVAWLVGGIDDLARYGRDVAPDALALARAHWPGALTLVVKASDAVPAAFRAPDNTIALRMPASELALALIREVGPLAASSANLSGSLAPGTFTEIDPALLAAVPALAADDQVQSGVASTVIDCSAPEPVLLREGDVKM